MNGAQDMGGMMGFGEVKPIRDEPVFHAEWEKRVFAMNLSLGPWNIDMTRHACERLHPVEYLSNSYYQIWLASIESLLLERGLVTPAELEAGEADGVPDYSPLQAADVASVVARGNPYKRPATAPARFAVGAIVRAKVMSPAGHTRLPRYARGRTGEIIATRGCHVFPDTNAAGDGEQAQWLYTVRFHGRDLWGAEAEPHLSVCIDAWEPYLESP